MTRSILNHRYLMKESERRIERASRSEQNRERSIAQRILEREERRESWTSSHSRLMKFVVAPSNVEAQFYNLRQTAAELTDRQAMFRYLRDNQISVQRRRALFRAFHPIAGYTATVIAEHESYLRAAASAVCAIHLGNKICRDGGFEQALADYDEAHRSYFCVYCDWVVAEAEQRESSTKPLLMSLKTDAMGKRSALLSADGGLDVSPRPKRAQRCRTSMEHLVTT